MKISVVKAYLQEELADRNSLRTKVLANFIQYCRL